MINRERLAQTFTTLCEIDSPSRHEKEIADYLHRQLIQLGVDSIIYDDSASRTGSDTGNIIARFSGNGVKEDAIFFACHMDTVEPARGIKVMRDGDIFTSQSDTILGSDDKSGIAPLLELMHVLQENDIPHCPIELIFTTCEEIGLLGAKAFNRSLLQATYGYALDSSSPDQITIGAPAANALTLTVYGRAAHSGSSPEEGINALAIAAKAISTIPLGRLDEISTSNLGLIEGGTATNIIPEKVIIKGEVRSHNPELLEKYTAEIIETFTSVANAWPSDDSGEKKLPFVEVEVYEEFPSMILDEGDPSLVRLQKAAAKIDQQTVFGIAGGGSDANIFNGYGLKTPILPTGMQKAHTTDEWIDLNGMVSLTELLVTMVRSDETAAQ